MILYSLSLFLSATLALQRFKIDLDLPAKERFVEPALFFKEKIRAAYRGSTQSVTAQWQTAIDYGYWIYNKESYEEEEGIAKIVGVDTKKLIASSFLRIANGTSIVARSKTGSLLHMRVTDYIKSEESKNTEYVADFFKNGFYSFSAALHGDSTSFSAAMKGFNFSISM